MDEPRARVEAEAEEPNILRRRFEGRWVVVRYVEGGAVEVLRAGHAAHGAVVRGAAIGGTRDQRLAQPVKQLLTSSLPAPMCGSDNSEVRLQVDPGAVEGYGGGCGAGVQEQPRRQELRRGGQVSGDLLLEDRA